MLRATPKCAPARAHEHFSLTPTKIESDSEEEIVALRQHLDRWGAQRESAKWLHLRPRPAGKMVNSTEVPVPVTPVNPLRAACLAASEPGLEKLNPYAAAASGVSPGHRRAAAVAEVSTPCGKRRGGEQDGARPAKSPAVEVHDAVPAMPKPAVRGGSPEFDLKSFMKSFQSEQQTMMQSFLGEQRARDLEREAAFESLRMDVRTSCEAVTGQVQELKASTVALGTRLNEVSACATDVRNRFEALEKRVESIEKGGHVAAAARLNMYQLPGQRPSGGGGGGGGGGPGSAEAGRFVPTKIYLRGWSKYGDPQSGISEDRVVTVMEALLSSLPAALRDRVLRCQAPYFRNWQGTFLLRETVSPDMAFELNKSMNEKLVEDQVLINGRKLYCVVEAPAWKRFRNGAIMRAKDKVLLLREGWEHKLKCDFAAGELWCTEPVLSLGQWRRNEEQWKWNIENLTRLQLSVADLERAAEVQA
jgi:hypothetical protein